MSNSRLFPRMTLSGVKLSSFMDTSMSRLPPPSAIFYTGSFFARIGKPEQALPELEASLALDPDSVDAHATLGEVLSQRKRKDKAHAEFQKAIAWHIPKIRNSKS